MSSTKSITGSPSPSPSKALSAEKRAVHNALERKRRDHIKDMFSQLKDAVPTTNGDKIAIKASRAQILKRASDYIQLMRRKNSSAFKELEELNIQITRTKKQIAKLETLRATNNYVAKLPHSSPSRFYTHLSSESITLAAPQPISMEALKTSPQQVHFSNPAGNNSLSMHHHPQPLMSSNIPLPPMSSYMNLFVPNQPQPSPSSPATYLADLPTPDDSRSVKGE